MSTFRLEENKAFQHFSTREKRVELFVKSNERQRRSCLRLKLRATSGEKNGSKNRDNRSKDKNSMLVLVACCMENIYPQYISSVGNFQFTISPLSKSSEN